MAAWKSPAHDGIPAGFFQTYWPIVQDSLISSIMEFFRHPVLAQEWNETTLVLIPKVPIPKKPQDFRSISLCNIKYKVIIKVLANRLRKVITSLVSQKKTGFVPLRHIGENVLIAHELVEFIRKRKSAGPGYAAIKLDMSKAFDRVSWSFLTDILRIMEFPLNWLQYIQQCVQTVSYAIKLNGRTSSSFTPTKGLRQGCPLSPSRRPLILALSMATLWE